MNSPNSQYYISITLAQTYSISSHHIRPPSCRCLISLQLSCKVLALTLRDIRKELSVDLLLLDIERSQLRWS